MLKGKLLLFILKQHPLDFKTYCNYVISRSRKVQSCKHSVVHCSDTTVIVLQSEFPNQIK